METTKQKAKGLGVNLAIQLKMELGAGKFYECLKQSVRSSHAATFFGVVCYAKWFAAVA